MSFSAKIAGTTYTVIEGSFQFIDKIDEHDACQFTVLDQSGSANFTKYQPVEISDSTLGTTIFTGIVSNPQMTQRLWPNTHRLWSIQCVDQTYRLDKCVSEKVYINQYSGTIAADQLQRYAANEHVSAACALSWSELLTEWQAGTMSGAAATTNAFDANPGDGDVELATAGSAVVSTTATTADWSAGAGSNTTAASNTLALSQVTGLCLSAKNVAAAGATQAYAYYTIWTGSFAVVSNNALNYKLWINASSPSCQVAIEGICADGTTFTSAALVDAWNLKAGPSQDLKGYADNQWYTRSISLAGLAGKTLVALQLAITGTTQGQYTAYFHAITVSGTGGFTVYNDDGVLTTNALAHNIGYSGITLTTPAVCVALNSTFTTTIDTSPAGVCQSSIVSWSAVVPAGTSVTAYASFNKCNQAVTNNGSIGFLLAGMALSTAKGAPANVSVGVTLVLSITGNDPTVTPTLKRLVVTVKSAYNASKADAVLSSAFGGTFSNTQYYTDGGTGKSWLEMVGWWQDWSQATGLPTAQTVYGSASPTQANVGGQLKLTTGTGTDVRSAPQPTSSFYVQNFTASLDVQIPATTNEQVCLVYRTTNWNNANNTFGWMVGLKSNNLQIGYGSNSGSSGTFTSVSTATVAFTAGSWHTLTVIVNGTSHIVQVDGVQYLSITNTNVNVSGGLAARASNTSGSTQSYYFKNFGYVAAQSGTYTTPSTSISSVGTIGSTYLLIDALYNTLPSGASITADTSIDSGSTWQAVTNGVCTGLPAGTNVAGKSLLLRFTLTVGVASTFLQINNFTLFLSSSYSSTGVWQNGPLGYDSFTKANQSGSWGTDAIGLAWSQVAGTDTLSVSSNKGVLTSASSAAANRMVLGSASVADCEVVCRITVGDVTGDTAGVLLRCDGTGANQYIARYAPAATSTLEIDKRVAGALTTLASPAAGCTFAANSLLWLRFRAVGTTLSVKAWLDGTTEPATFAGSATDSSLASGQFGLYASGAPVSAVKFDSFKATAYPDTLLLSSVGRATSSLVNWNALVPASTTLVATTSIDGGASYQAVAVAGDAISGIALQPAAVVDSFTSDSSADYTQSNFGGTTGTWTWDTANGRLVGSAGATGTLVNSTALTSADSQTRADLDQADGSGLIANYQDASNLYYAQVWDASGTGGTQNSVKLFKRAGGTSTQLGSTAPIVFPRGTHHFFVLDVQAGVLTFSMDGAQLIQHTDGSPLAAGKSGLLLSTLLRCYELRIQQYGEDVSATTVYTRLTLTTTDSAATPQALDLQTFVGSATFGKGTLIPKATYNDANSYVSADIEDLKNQSLYWWLVGMLADGNGNYPVTFTARDAVLAPWPLDESNTQSIGGQAIGDLLLANLNVANSANLYRNRQKVKGAIATNTYTQSVAGDGKTRTWNVANPLSAPPTTWTLNGQGVTFGVQNVDTARDFYYTVGSTALTQDSSGTLLQEADLLEIEYSGSSVVDVVRDNTAFAGTITQSGLAAITASGGMVGDSGIVTNIVDVSGQAMSVAAAEVYGDQLLQRYGVIGVTLTFTTLRAGLAAGQQLSVYTPSVNVNDLAMLVSGVQRREELSQAVAGGVLYVYEVTAQTGAALGSWVKLLASGLNS